MKYPKTKTIEQIIQTQLEWALAGMARSRKPTNLKQPLLISILNLDMKSRPRIRGLLRAYTYKLYPTQRNIKPLKPEAKLLALEA